MNLLRCAPIAALTLLVAQSANAQDRDEPRYRAVMELMGWLQATETEPIASFLRDRLAPELVDREGYVDELARAHSQLAGAQIEGAVPESPFGARVLMHLPDGTKPSVSFEIEREEPHRFVRISPIGLGIGPGPLSDEEIVAALEAHVEQLVAEERFSGSVLLARGDTPLLRKAYGQASKRFGVPNRADTKFNLGSMNKMFTGVAVCQLAEQGKLDFDDTIGKHLPDYPNAEVRDNVTIHQLLTHTSGLGSYWNEAWEACWATLRTVADLLPIFVDEPLAFEPGAQFQYSNAGPIVLGLIIEAITGQSYFDYVREHVHDPAGMHDTDCYAMDTPVPNLAIGYVADRSETGELQWRNNLFQHSVKGGPAGGGFSTVDDLLRFSLALQSHQLLSPEMTERMLTGKVPMGPDNSYAYLFGDHRSGDFHAYGHNGGAPGISAEFAFFPEQGYTLAVLSNYGGGAGAVASLARELVARQPAVHD